MNLMIGNVDIQDDHRWVSDMIDGITGLMESVDDDLLNTNQTDMPEVVDGLADLYDALHNAKTFLLRAHTELSKLEQL